MGMLEKASDLFRKKPTKAEQERIDKKKVDADRARMEDIRARLDAIVIRPNEGITEEDAKEIRRTFFQLSEAAKNAGAVGFPVETIDRHISGMVTVLEKAKDSGGSYKTIMRCLQGITYGIRIGHAPCSENVPQEEIVRERENTAERYLLISQNSLDIDHLNKDIEKKKAQKKQRENEFGDVVRQAKESQLAHPKAWEDLRKLTPSEKDRLTGTMKTIASLEKKGIDLRMIIEDYDVMIGHSQEMADTMETSISALYLQQKNWESELGSTSSETIGKLGDEFKRELLRQKDALKRMDASSVRINDVINAAVAGNEDKEIVINNHERFQEVLREMEEEKRQEEAARLAYEQRQEALRAEAQNEQQGMITN